MKPNKICIIDGSPLVQDIYQIIFKQYELEGVRIIQAQRGKQALFLLRAHLDTDLIVLDMNLPDINGLALLGFIKQQKYLQDIPVIVVSSSGSEEDVMDGLQMGAEAFIKKPFLPANLIRVIDRLACKNV